VNLSFNETRASLLLCAYYCARHGFPNPDLKGSERPTTKSEDFFSLRNTSALFREISLQHLVDGNYLIAQQIKPEYGREQMGYVLTEKAILGVEKFVAKTDYEVPDRILEKDKMRVVTLRELLLGVDLDSFNAHFELPS
jgi:hypothetical protein